MNKTEYQLLKFIHSHRFVHNELEAFSLLSISLVQGCRALVTLQRKKYILGGLFWNYLTPAGRQALDEMQVKEAFEIEILI